MDKPFIIGKKIYLRPLETKDLTDAYQQWFNDAEVCAFNSHHRFPNYKGNMDAYYESVVHAKTVLVLAIMDKSADAHVGNITLQHISPVDRSAEFAIIIGDKKSWGKGIGREAGVLIIAHGFHSLNLHRIHCGTSSENIGMQKLARALGFKKEGVSREALYKNGAYQDIVQYGLLKDDYEQKHSRRRS